LIYENTNRTVDEEQRERAAGFMAAGEPQPPLVENMIDHA
jgi:hypothetical protein